MKFVSVTKPGIIFGNIVTVSGGYFLGTHANFCLSRFLITLVGMVLVIASGCVFNNYIDRDIDRLMERTKGRVLVQGLMSLKIAMLYAIILGIVGLLILYLKVNPLTAAMALIGLFFYVVVYTLCLKRKSSYGTIIGGIAGAMPPVVGYVATTNRLDLGAALLFLILFFWQIPHVYAISISRLKDYSAAAIPILPLKKSLAYTKICMVLYTFAFCVVAILPSVFGYAGVIYFIVALVLGLMWLGISLQGLRRKTNDIKWSRKMFVFSIITIMLLCIAMAVP